MLEEAVVTGLTELDTVVVGSHSPQVTVDEAEAEDEAEEVVVDADEVVEVFAGSDEAVVAQVSHPSAFTPPMIPTAATATATAFMLIC